MNPKGEKGPPEIHPLVFDWKRVPKGERLGCETTTRRMDADHVVFFDSEPDLEPERGQQVR